MNTGVVTFDVSHGPQGRRGRVGDKGTFPGAQSCCQQSLLPCDGRAGQTVDPRSDRHQTAAASLALDLVFSQSLALKLFGGYQAVLASCQGVDFG
jgi:hypothetical protein